MNLNDHLEFLRENLFQTTERWPQFELFISAICRMADKLPEKSTVLELGRTTLYGGASPTAPIFSRHIYGTLDQTPPENLARGAYNAITDPRFIKIETPLTHLQNDLVIIPNLVHHHPDPWKLFAQAYSFLKPGGTLMVFEPTVREIHQAPDHYFMFTPYGMKRALEAHKFKDIHWDETGGPFSAAAYCLDQGLQYMDDPDERAKIKEQIKQLLSMDDQYPVNLERRWTRFPTAFLMYATK